MPYYKDKTNALHFLDDANFLNLLPEGCIEITTEDAEDLQRLKAIPTPEELQATQNAEARAYLASTDWYVIRKQETGQEIPVDISLARQAARDSVI